MQLSWTVSSVSDGSSAPGAPVAAVPWGQRLAVFVTGIDGGIYTTGGNAEGGFGPWASISQGSSTPGAPVTAVRWGQRFAVFVAGTDGGVYTTGGDPQGGFGPWASVSQGSSKPGGRVTAIPWGQRFALFLADSAGGVYTTGGDPQGGFGPWASVSEGATAPGAPVTAVPWGQRCAVFLADPNGGVYTTGGDPQGGFGPWASVSEGSTIPGAPVTAVPWGHQVALFIADRNGGVYTAAGDPQAGFGPWASVAEGRTTPGGSVTAIPRGQRFALFIVDPNGAIYWTEGDPQQDFEPWKHVRGIKATPGSPVTAVALGDALALFISDVNGRIVTLKGEKAITTQFSPMQHGWHFPNSFVNHVIGNVLETQGLCGGMAYSALDYYFAGVPIPTHRPGDFGDPMASVPPDGRLHTMIFNRLIDSFKDNFGKWSCIYPALDAAIGAALGIVVGGGILGAIGAAGGFIYGELNNVFECPRGGAAGMTRRELPILTGNFLDKGIPVPLGLIFDEDILHIGDSHQVVAYGYSMSGTTMTIKIYDNRYPDAEHTLKVDASNPGRIDESDGSQWAGLLVEDAYRPQWPSYGADISIASAQSVELNGVRMKPLIESVRKSVTISMVPKQPAATLLVDDYSVTNGGEFDAHYLSFGIEIHAPDDSQSFVQAAAPAPDNRLAPGDRMPVSITVPSFGSVPGTYTIFAGFYSVGGQPTWCRVLYPPASVTTV